MLATKGLIFLGESVVIFLFFACFINQGAVPYSLLVYAFKKGMSNNH